MLSAESEPRWRGPGLSLQLVSGPVTFSTTAVDTRLWAIKTSNLHATLPLPND
jgi:hypothetical protein